MGTRPARAQSLPAFAGGAALPAAAVRRFNAATNPASVGETLPAGIIALGIAAGTAVLHAVWYGMLSTLGIFDAGALDEAEKAVYKEKRHCFWFGEVATAAALAGAVAAPVGSILAVKAGPALAFTATAVLFLPLFVFLPKLLKRALAADTDAVISMFGKNEQVQRVFWGIFAVFAGLVLAETLDPAAAQNILAILAGMG